MIDLVQIGRKISLLRQEKGLSQQQLADILMVSRQAVSAWEVGKSAPSIDNVIELSHSFNVPFEDILCMNESVVLNPLNPYEGHDRNYILRSFIAGTIKVDFKTLLYHSTGEERMCLLRAVNEGKIDTDVEDLKDQLTQNEYAYLKKERRSL